MANTIFSSEGALLFIMVATVALGFWLQRFKVFKTLGPALTVIVMGIVMSNLRIVPTSSPTYDAISGYCVPLSVSICLLRRAQILNEHKIVIGSTEFDYDAMTVTTDKESLVLPKKEFLLLYKLAASPGRTFTKQQLMDEVWGYETEADPHTIEVHIGRIRERFKDNPDFEIVTMRGIGYKVVKK